MISAFIAAGELHAVHVIHQQGLTKIRARGFCNADEDAGTGVYQVADWAFDGRPKYGDKPVCGKCAGTVVALAKASPR
jgi:hypothetical protein